MPERFKHTDAVTIVKPLPEGERLPSEQRVLVMAKSLIASYLPALITAEPTFLIVRTNLRRRSDINGNYYKKFNGVHYMAIGTPNADEDRNDLKGEPTVEEVTTLAHELMHQKHAEMVGNQQFDDPNLYVHIPDEVFGLDPRTLSQVLSTFPQDWVNIFPKGTLKYAVVEGVALHAELLLMERISEDPNIPYGYTLEEIKRLRQKRLEQIREEMRWEAPHYRDGYFRLIGKLLKKDRQASLLELMRGINLTPLGSIAYGSDKYREVMRRPKLVFMLGEKENEEMGLEPK